MADINREMIEKIIRNILDEKLEKLNCNDNKNDFEKHVDKSGIISVKASTVKPDRFDTGNDNDKVYIKDIITLEESPRLGCGIMEMEKTSWAWTLKYDEVQYIIEGRMEIDIDGRKVVANKGEVLFIPKNSSIHFTVPDFARFMYVTYPADWAEQL